MGRYMENNGTPPVEFRQEAHAAELRRTNWAIGWTFAAILGVSLIALGLPVLGRAWIVAHPHDLVWVRRTLYGAAVVEVVSLNLLLLRIFWLHRAWSRRTAAEWKRARREERAEWKGE